MSNKILLTILAAGVLWLATTSFVQHRVLNIKQNPYLEIGETKLKTEIADDEAKRTLGLSRRASLPAGQGLLFIFDTPGQYGFWMKDMNFPIDIIWIDANWQIADITAKVSPESFPQIFYPRATIKYVLETNAGWALKNNLQIGESVLFNK